MCICAHSHTRIELSLYANVKERALYTSLSTVANRPPNRWKGGEELEKNDGNKSTNKSKLSTMSQYLTLARQCIFTRTANYVGTYESENKDGRGRVRGGGQHDLYYHVPHTNSSFFFGDSGVILFQEICNDFDSTILSMTKFHRFVGLFEKKYLNIFSVHLLATRLKEFVKRVQPFMRNNSKNSSKGRWTLSRTIINQI